MNENEGEKCESCGEIHEGGVHTVEVKELPSGFTPVLAAYIRTTITLADALSASEGVPQSVRGMVEMIKEKGLESIGEEFLSLMPASIMPHRLEIGGFTVLKNASEVRVYEFFRVIEKKSGETRKTVIREVIRDTLTDNALDAATATGVINYMNMKTREDWIGKREACALFKGADSITKVLEACPEIADVLAIKEAEPIPSPVMIAPMSEERRAELVKRFGEKKVKELEKRIKERGETN